MLLLRAAIFFQKATEQKVHKVHEFHNVHPGKRHPRESDCRAMLAPLGLKYIVSSYGVSNKSILT